MEKNNTRSEKLLRNCYCTVLITERRASGREKYKLGGKGALLMLIWRNITTRQAGIANESWLNRLTSANQNTVTRHKNSEWVRKGQNWHSPVYSGRLEHICWNSLLLVHTTVHWCYWNFRLEYVMPYISQHTRDEPNLSYAWLRSHHYFIGFSFAVVLTCTFKEYVT